MAQRWREVAAHVPERDASVFAKIGDSATVSRTFLECFGDDDEVDLGEHAALMETVRHFRAGNAGGRSPFTRESLAAAVGWSTRHVLVGDPPPLLAEVRAINPRFAFTLTGGNDVEGRDPRRFANRLLRVVDHLERRGVIPILGSLTPRDDDPEADRWAERYDAITLGVARGRRLPFIDFRGELRQLPRHGLAADGVHPNVLVAHGHARPCHLTEEGLTHGANRRNLLALRMLDRIRRVIVDGERAPDPAPPVPAGRGTTDDAFSITTLPFTDLRSTAGARSEIDSYPGCAQAPDETGPEIVYRFRVERPMRLRLWVYPRPDADVDVHLLADRPDGEACIARDDTEIVREVPPGTYHLVIDSFTEDGQARSGEFLLVVDLARD